MGTLDLTFIDNGSHAYLEVSFGVANALDVDALHSKYSYYDGRNRVYYFEEDVDAPEVLNALKALGYNYKIWEHYDEGFNPKRFPRAAEVY